MSASTSRRYPPELRERAVRMVAEVCASHPGESPILSPPGLEPVVVFWIQLISQATGVWVCLHAAAYSAWVR
jgi:transposase-like protein